jgi:hypothetical protein
VSAATIKARLAAATPAPWIAASGKGKVSVVGTKDNNGHSYALAVFSAVPATHRKGDAELIAHAPTDLALLMAVVEHAKLDHYLTEHFLRADDQYVSVPGCACPLGADLHPCPALATLDALEASD